MDDSQITRWRDVTGSNPKAATAARARVAGYQKVLLCGFLFAFSSAASAQLTITTPAGLPSGEVPVPYSRTLQATGGASPFTWSLDSGTLPAGLMLSSSGIISGTPTTAQTTQFTVRVTDGDLLSTTKIFILTIVFGGPVIDTPAGLPSGEVAVPYSQTLQAMVVDAAVEGMGAAMGHSRVIAREMERGALVPLFDRQVEAPARCCLITTADSRRNPGVRAFRKWIRKEA